MIQHAIALLFGINEITPIKACWVAITCINVVMMWAMCWISRKGWAGPYFGLSMFVAMFQASDKWSEKGEVYLAGVTTLWILSMLPRDKHGRIFALSIGLVVTCVLMLAVPPPWAGYDPVIYETRLYSTAAFLGISLGSALMTRNPSTMLCVPWFMAVLIAGSQRGFDRWMVGIYTNLIWSLCLICWLYLYRRTSERDSVESGLYSPSR